MSCNRTLKHELNAYPACLDLLTVRTMAESIVSFAFSIPMRKNKRPDTALINGVSVARSLIGRRCIAAQDKRNLLVGWS